MKVYMLFTGGTIGSAAMENGLISPNVSMADRLLDLYSKSEIFHLQNHASELELITDTPYQILSENLSACHLLSLIRYVKKGIRRHDLDGIIIMHGTDTLQYTAATLSYVFENAQIPIVLVSSNYILDDKRANGLINFHYALEFIKGGYGQGVFVSYSNRGSVPTIHCGTRLQASLPFSDDVYSIGNAWFGQYISMDNIPSRQYIPNKEIDYKKSDNSPFSIISDIQLMDQTETIMRIAPYPGMKYPVITQQTKVILHESYHSGTIGISKQLKETAARALELRIPFYITGNMAQEAEYETIAESRSLGIIPLKGCSVISQYCKLWLAVSNELDVRQIMELCIASDRIF